MCANVFHVLLTRVLSSRKYFAYFVNAFFLYYCSEPNFLLLIIKLLHFQWHLTESISLFALICKRSASPRQLQERKTQVCIERFQQTSDFLLQLTYYIIFPLDQTWLNNRVSCKIQDKKLSVHFLPFHSLDFSCGNSTVLNQEPGSWCTRNAYLFHRGKF